MISFNCSEFYNVEEIAKLLKISKPKAYKLVRSMDSSDIFLDSQFLVPKKEFYQWCLQFL